MSAETDRKRAIASGADIFGNYNINTRGGIERLLDAGWVPPAQRNEELRQTAAWQRDARRAFEAVEQIAKTLEDSRMAPIVAHRLREALGDQFRTPEASP